ncbi:MAG TPA: pyridoxamine 5'-phosphate oxidase family protein [Ilumatobacteraceae bacterium]
MTTAAATWDEFEVGAPELAAAVRARFESTKHHVLATLRADGAPRVSGTEVQFVGGRLYAGMMPGSVKANDLLRDPRFALHANPGDGSMAGGDAKVGGIAEHVTDPDELARYVESVEPPDFFLAHLRLTDAVLTSLHPDGDRLVIESWRPGGPVVRRERT